MPQNDRLDNTEKIYLWKLIEKKVFEYEVNTNYSNNLFISFYYKITQNEVSNSNSIINSLLRFNIDAFPKYDVKLYLGNNFINFNYDNQFIAETNFDFNYLKLPEIKEKLENINEDDIEEILKNFIVHPALHFHFDEESKHEIRICFAYKNPLIFLYHIAIQLSDIENRYNNSEIKKKEIRRLAKLIFDKKIWLKNTRNTIPLSEVFKNR